MKQTITAAIIAVLLASCAKQECPNPEPIPEPDKDCTCGKVVLVKVGTIQNMIAVRNDCSNKIWEFPSEFKPEIGKVICILETW